MSFPSAVAPASMRHIRRLAMAVRLLCLIAALALLVMPLAFWSSPRWVAQMVQKDFGFGLVQLDANARLAGLAATALPVCMSLWALWSIWCLFGCYARGDLLSMRPARHLRRLSIAMVSLAAALPLGQTLTALALTLGNPPGQRQLWVGLSSQHYLSLLFGLVLLAISTVLVEAARVADENASFV
ncbi:hypothetical protein BH11PSE10_BH11PSE10_10640 [soil metagenome]